MLIDYVSVSLSSPGGLFQLFIFQLIQSYSTLDGLLRCSEAAQCYEKRT